MTRIFSQDFITKLLKILSSSTNQGETEITVKRPKRCNELEQANSLP
jgi:hypothetical protein